MNRKKLENTQPQNFYRLASPLSARVEARAKKVSLWLIFAIIWSAGITGITIANLATGAKFDTLGIVLSCVFACVGIGFIAFGIYDQRRQLVANKQERELLKNCLCTDGRITRCVCIEKISRSHSSHSGSTETYYYDVTLTYTYTIMDGKKVEGVHSATYQYNPNFYKGQYLMIAFNAEGKSRILCDFKFKPEDEQAFLKNEAARSDDDFDGLDGKLIKYKNPVVFKSSELPHVWLWAALALSVFLVGYTVPISICVAPQLVSGHILPDIIALPLIYVPTAFFTFFIIYFLKQGLGGRLKLKRILNNEPRFTKGKIFASEKTYRGNSKRVLFCYIDDKGEKITKDLTTPYYLKIVQDQVLSVTIAYDKDGNSVPLENG